MRHDRIAENEGLKPRANSRPALSEPAPQPHPERDHLKGAFYQPSPLPASRAQARTRALCWRLRSPAATFEGRLMSDDDPDKLAARLAGYAASTALRNKPQLRRDLLPASERVSDFQALLRTWQAAFDDLETVLERHIGQEFAELLGTTGMTGAWKRCLRLEVVTTVDMDSE
jgi:hypothetical protein